jgi:AcrR family transcriptional regulator
VAAAAGVTPDVVSKYYQSKDKLFVAALRLPFDPANSIPTLVAPGIDGMGERLTRVTLETLGDPETRADLIALARAGTSTGKAVSGLKGFVEQDIVDRLAVVIGVPDARLRANLITSYLLGVAINRYVIRLDPIASLSDEEVVRLVSPTVQDWLTPTKPLPGGIEYYDKSKTKDENPFDSFADWSDK